MQHGAVARRGVDLAAHLVLSFLEHCCLAAKSCFVLYLDLAKAFDPVVRELVLGIPADVERGCPTPAPSPR
eukprot:7015386-Lingulodinium_polyedra.AAC.1